MASILLLVSRCITVPWRTKSRYPFPGCWRELALSCGKGFIARTHTSNCKVSRPDVYD